MGDEALLGLDLPVTQGGSDALTTAIHEGGRSQQAHIVIADAQPRGFAEQPRLHAESFTRLRRQRINERKSDVVTGSGIFGPGIAEADNETQVCHRGQMPTAPANGRRSEEHTSELQSLMRISYAVFCLK